ncbi:MAG: PTS sugar transporter subunit IIB [Candidatus Onthomonas sp.]
MTGIRLLICCPNGAGVSLMMESMVRTAAQKLNLPIQRLHHGSIREGVRRAGEFDLVLCPRELTAQLSHWQGKVQVIGLNNPLSRRELEEKLAAYMQQEKSLESAE